VENPERLARGLEICGASNLSGRAFLRLFVYDQIPVYRDLAAHAACGARVRRGCRCLDLGRMETAGGSGPSRAAFISRALRPRRIFWCPRGRLWASGWRICPRRDFVCCWLSVGAGYGERKEILAWGLLAAIVLILSVRTVLRNRDWKDNFALYSSAVRAVPNDAKMHSNLAGQYLHAQSVGFGREGIPRSHCGLIPIRRTRWHPMRRLELQRRAITRTPAAMMEKALSMSGRNNLNYDFDGRDVCGDPR
jgi:hypothetical protein